MGVLLVVLAVVVVIGLAVGLRRAERRTFTFTEPVRRVEVDLRAGAVSLAAGDGPVGQANVERSRDVGSRTDSVGNGLPIGSKEGFLLLPRPILDLLFSF